MPSDPFLFTNFLLEKAKSKGVELLEATATSLSIENGRVTGVEVDCTDTKTMTLPCDSLVIAAGPWCGPLSNSKFRLPKPIPITSYAGHSVLLRPTVATSADCLFMTVRTRDSTYHAEIIPRSSGQIYISGINDALVLPPTPNAAIPLKTEIAKLKEIADAILPEYSIEKEQLCFRPMTEKGTPFICPYPQVEGVYVGAGHGHFGIILGPGTGKVLSEMILGEELSADISQFSL
jgi:glycine/D-amino acid oxidase-like deaminating enzyme